MPTETEKTGVVPLNPWFPYQEWIRNFWNALAKPPYDISREEKSAYASVPLKASSGKKTHPQPMKEYLYQYDEFMKYWRFHNGPPPEPSSNTAADAAISQHGSSKERPVVQAIPYEPLHQHYLEMLGGIEAYLLFWKSTFDQLFGIRTSGPEATRLFSMMPLKVVHDTWLESLTLLMMPWTNRQSPVKLSSGHFFWMPDMMRLWMESATSAATSTWISLLKKDIDLLIYETAGIRENLNQLQSHDLLTRNGVDRLSEIILLQKESAVRIVNLTMELAALKTALGKRQQKAHSKQTTGKKRPRTLT